MNILVKVMVCLMALALMATLISQRALQTAIEKNSFCSSINTHLALYSKLQKKIATKNQNKSSPKKPTDASQSSKQQSASSFISHRKNENIPPMGKFNLCALFSTGALNKQCYAIAANLLKKLYGQTNFYREEDTERLLDFFQECIQKEPSPQSLQECAKYIPADDLIFYKIFKGTATYDLEKRIGYPPLSDFFSIDTKQKKRPIHFAFATIELLEQYFPSSLIEAILEKEEAKWRKQHKKSALTRQELFALLTEQGHATLIAEVTELMLFSQRSEGNPQLIGIDPKNDLKIKRISVE